MSTIAISKLDKAEVLAALYNASKQQGMGFMYARGYAGMTKEQAASEIADTGHAEPNFDYLHGRVMKIKLSDTLETRLYDRDNGEGAAARALAPLLAVAV